MKNSQTGQIEQQNDYRVFDSMGRRTEIVIMASNIGEAYKKSKMMIKQIGSSYYKLKRI